MFGFKRPLPDTARSSAYAAPFGEGPDYGRAQFTANVPVRDSEATYPEMMDRDLIAGDTTENWQFNSQMPQHVGITHRSISPAAGLPVTHRDINNHVDYTVGGTVASNDQVPYFDRGPVTGGASNMTGAVANYQRAIIRSDGAVTGTGPAYGQQLAQAFFQREAADIVEAHRAASILAVI